jgi:hypothetical protein
MRKLPARNATKIPGVSVSLTASEPERRQEVETLSAYLVVDFAAFSLPLNAFFIWSLAYC